MSRGDGFDIMDVSVAILRDTKVRRLARHAPTRWPVAVVAYLAAMAASWEAGERVSVEDAWPAEMPVDQLAAEALAHVGLVDAHGLIVSATWEAWFEPAKRRREEARARWNRYNAKRDAGTTSLPRGNDAGTATSVPSVPSEPTVVTPQPPSRGGRRSDGTNHRSVAARLTAQAEEAERERKARRNARYLAMQDGRITPEQMAAMNESDAPLTDIPTERGAAFAPRLLA